MPEPKTGGWGIYRGHGGGSPVLAMLIGAAALTAPGLAHAGFYPLGVWDGWEVHGGALADGRQSCFIGRTLDRDRRVILQHIRGEPDFLVRLSSSRWVMEPRRGQQATFVPVSIVARAGSWQVQAEVRWPSELRWRVSSDDMTRLEALARRGGSVSVDPAMPREQPWAISLAGAGPALTHMASCVRALGSYAGATPPAWAGASGRRQ